MRRPYYHATTNSLADSTSPFRSHTQSRTTSKSAIFPIVPGFEAMQPTPTTVETTSLTFANIAPGIRNRIYDLVFHSSDAETQIDLVQATPHSKALPLTWRKVYGETKVRGSLNPAGCLESTLRTRSDNATLTADRYRIAYCEFCTEASFLLHISHTPGQ